MIKNLRALFVPYLLISSGLLVAYSLLDWIFLIKRGPLIVEQITNFAAPALLAFVAVYLWLRPALRALLFDDPKYRVFYYLVAGFGIAAPTLIAQAWVTAATGKLTRVSLISQVGHVPITRYYSATHLFADKRFITFERFVERDRSELHLSVFFVAPLFDSAEESNSKTCHAWLAGKYAKTISARQTEDQREEEFRRLVSDSFLQFSSLDPESFTYFQNASSNDDRKGWELAIQRNECRDPAARPVILVGQTGTFEGRTGNKLAWVFRSFAIGAGLWFVLLLPGQVDERKLRRNRTGRLIRADLHSITATARLAKLFPIGSTIIAINVLVFLSMVFCGLGFFSFQSRDLVTWGAIYSPLIRHGQWHRLITSLFIHGGLMHLLMNLYGLFFATFLLEGTIGRIRFFVAYLLTGITASLTSVWLHKNGVSVGASGAIFGLFGVLLVLLAARSKLDLRTKPVLASVALFVALNLLMGGVTIGTDNAAHAGGLISGLVLGIIFLLMDQRMKSQPRGSQ